MRGQGKAGQEARRAGAPPRGGVTVVVALVFGAGVSGVAAKHLALAQGAAPAVAVPPALPSSVSPVVPIPGAPPATIPPPGTHLGAAEVSIVGGNLASARERALTEALRQAVGDAINVVAPDARTAQPKAVIQAIARARVFVQRYRTREEGETGRGSFAMRLEADVDETSLRRAVEGASSPGSAGAVAAAGLPSCLLVTNGPIEASEAVFRALAAAGVKVERARDALQPTQAVEAAARAGLAAVVFVTATATSEGPVRGVGVEAVSCTLALRMVTSGTGMALAEDSRNERAFAGREDAARRDCFARAASVAARHVMPQPGGPRGVGDLRTVTADVAVVEPAVVLTLVRQVRASGSVSAVDLRRIQPGRVELGIRSRLTAAALAVALARDAAAGPLVFSAVEVSGDLVRMTVRSREVVAPLPATGTAPPGAPAPRDGSPMAPPQVQAGQSGRPVTP